MFMKHAWFRTTGWGSYNPSELKAAAVLFFISKLSRNLINSEFKNKAIF